MNIYALARARVCTYTCIIILSIHGVRIGVCERVRVCVHPERKKTTTETGRSGLVWRRIAVNWTFLKYIFRQGRVVAVAVIVVVVDDRVCIKILC